MSKQLENKFTWMMENFSELGAKRCYSDQFVVGGCKWHVLAFPKGNGDDCLSLYLEVADSKPLPSGWRRHAKVRFLVVNQFSELSSKVLEIQRWFSASERGWGFARMMTLTELHGKGFLLNNKLIVEVEVDVLEVIGKLDVSEKSEKATESLSNTEEPLVADAPAVGPQGVSPCQQEQKTVDASEEDSDHNASLEDSDHDTSEEDSDHDASEEDSDASSAVLNDGAGDTSSLNPPEPLKEASDTVENGDAECNNVGSSSEASTNLRKEIQSEKETMVVNGFQVLFSQVKSVSKIFSRHPDTASDFRPKNQQLRTAYMNVLLSLIERACQSPQELSEDDLSDANNTLTDLMDAGLKLDWLKTKLEELSKKKKEEQAAGVRLQELGQELQKLKLIVSGLEAKLEKEKAKISAAKSPLSFDDAV